MIVSMFKGFFSAFWVLLKWPVIIGSIFIAVFLFLVLLNYLNLYIFKKQRPKKGEHNTVKKPGFFKKLLIDAPKRVAQDALNADPEFFKYQGLILYCGDQGAGKTISMIHDTRQIQLEYPKAKCLSNCAYKYQNAELKHWKQMLNYKNDKKGVIIQMDEIQTWFCSLASKDMPPEMIEQISQNRKQRRVWFGTAQRFNRVAKPIREQTVEVRNCITLLKCITIVHRVKPIIDSEGNVEKFKSLGWYWFVHDDELRDMYDTYKVIESLTKTGFKPAAEQISNYNNASSIVNLNIDKNVAKKLAK